LLSTLLQKLKCQLSDGHMDREKDTEMKLQTDTYFPFLLLIRRRSHKASVPHSYKI